MHPEFRKYGYPGKGKGKAVPLQAWSGPDGSRKLRFPDFVTTAQDGGRLSAVRTGRLYPQDRKDFMSMKNALTPAGIEPATFRFVAQHLNRGPPRKIYLQENTFFYIVYHFDVCYRCVKVKRRHISSKRSAVGVAHKTAHLSKAYLMMRLWSSAGSWNHLLQILVTEIKQ